MIWLPHEDHYLLHQPTNLSWYSRSIGWCVWCSLTPRWHKTRKRIVHKTRKRKNWIHRHRSHETWTIRARGNLERSTAWNQCKNKVWWMSWVFREPRSWSAKPTSKTLAGVFDEGVRRGFLNTQTKELISTPQNPNYNHYTQDCNPWKHF